MTVSYLLLLTMCMFSLVVPCFPDFVFGFVIIRLASVEIDFVIPVFSVLVCVPVLVCATCLTALAKMMARFVTVSLVRIVFELGRTVRRVIRWLTSVCLVGRRKVAISVCISMGLMLLTSDNLV